MITPDDIRKKTLNKWKDYRKSLYESIAFAKPLSFFPLTIPSDRKPSDSWTSTVNQVETLFNESKDNKGKGYRIIWNDSSSKRNINNSQIKKIVIETEEDYLFLTNKHEEKAAIISCLSSLTPLFSKYEDIDTLMKWATSNAALVEEKIYDENYWTDVSKVVEWAITSNEKNKYFIREIPLEVHTKFIETNATAISSLIRVLKEMPETETTSFENLLGVKKKRSLIRFRMKFKALYLEEMAIPSTSFSHLDTILDISEITKAFIIENESVYLSFPMKDDEMIIYGGGYQETIISGEWLSKISIHYFGDLDEHGLDILSSFRKSFPHAKSFLMNYSTFMEFYKFSVKGNTLKSDDGLCNLTNEEKGLLVQLRNNPNHNRLEQERIPHSYIIRAKNSI